MLLEVVLQNVAKSNFPWGPTMHRFHILTEQVEWNTSACIVLSTDDLLFCSACFNYTFSMQQKHKFTKIVKYIQIQVISVLYDY